MEQEKYYAQFGEDRLLHKIFGNKTGNCIEVGGFDGITGSNTFFFEKIGWNCAIVEADPVLCDKIKNNRPRTSLFRCAASDRKCDITFSVAYGVEPLSSVNPSAFHGQRVRQEGGSFKEIIVPAKPMHEIIKETGWSHIDFISIDVEGHELQVVEGIDFSKVDIRIIIIENNSYESNSKIYDLLKRADFRRFNTSGVNDWYCKRNDALFSIFGSCRAAILEQYRRSRLKLKRLLTNRV